MQLDGRNTEVYDDRTRGGGGKERFGSLSVYVCTFFGTGLGFLRSLVVQVSSPNVSVEPIIKQNDHPRQSSQTQSGTGKDRERG